MNYRIEDLGVAGVGETTLDGYGFLARHPRTNEEVVIHPTMEHGFVAINAIRKSGVPVCPDRSLFERTSRGAAQAPDGCVYHLGFYKGQCYAKQSRWALLRWDWERPVSVPVLEGDVPADTGAQLQFDPDGALYLTSAGTLSQFDPRTGKSKTLAQHASPAACGQRDGFIYFVSESAVWCFDPRTGKRSRVLTDDGRSCPVSHVLNDGQGRAIMPVVVASENGRTYWLELCEGRALRVDAAEVQLAETLITHLDIAQADTGMTHLTPYAFRDGGYISRIVGREVTCVDPAGKTTTFPIELKDRPLQLFSMEVGGGRIWLGTVLPLYLLSYDPRSGTFANHGNPSPALGEIYNMVWSGNRLFLASYTGAHVTRFDRSRPRRVDKGAQANPRQLGQIKPNGPSLHRIHGRAMDREGNVYFAAFGDYGCVDSGVCRINIRTEEMQRWIYPETRMSALTYLPQTDQLLVCERKQGDSWLRLTFISPRTGDIISSERMIEDEGDVTSWLHDGGDWVYGLHDYRATIFAYSLKERQIVRSIRELRFGAHCKESLIVGPDDRIWGLTAECVFAVDRELTAKARLADYKDEMLIAHSRFNLCFGPDGHLYFMNGAHLMRMRWD